MLRALPNNFFYHCILQYVWYRYEAATSLSMQSSTSESTSNNRNPSRSAFDNELKYDLGLKWINNER